MPSEDKLVIGNSRHIQTATQAAITSWEFAAQVKTLSQRVMSPTALEVPFLGYHREGRCGKGERHGGRAARTGLWAASSLLSRVARRRSALEARRAFRTPSRRTAARRSWATGGGAPGGEREKGGGQGLAGRPRSRIVGGLQTPALCRLA